MGSGGECIGKQGGQYKRGGSVSSAFASQFAVLVLRALRTLRVRKTAKGIMLPHRTITLASHSSLACGSGRTNGLACPPPKSESGVIKRRDRSQLTDELHTRRAAPAPSHQ